jgi:uncharacterized OB-fold protein
MEDKEISASEQVLQVPFVYSAGPTASRFLVGLRDEKRIYGIRCAACAKVFVPPRGRCPVCQAPLDDWVEVGPAGTLTNFTVVHYRETVHPAAAPLAIGIIQLDGADTGLVHLVRPPAGAELRIGMRVQAVWAGERRGHILDLAAFEPV